jgi:hypothetical protein
MERVDERGTRGKSWRCARKKDGRKEGTGRRKEEEGGRKRKEEGGGRGKRGIELVSPHFSTLEVLAPTTS